MAKIQLVIFDFDGTLVDTAPDLIRSANLYMQRRGFPKISEERIRSEIGMGLRKLILDVYPEEHSGKPNLEREIERDFTAIYEKEFLKTPTLFPGALEFLLDCPCQIAIVSNKRAKFIHPILQKLTIDTLPWVQIVGGDTFANMKPHPEPFMKVIEAAGVELDETLIVGDGSPDIEGGQAIGCRSVAVDFGYSPSDTLMDLGAWKCISHFEELGPLIRSIT